jgi:hypothetical protein
VAARRSWKPRWLHCWRALSAGKARARCLHRLLSLDACWQLVADPDNCSVGGIVEAGDQHVAIGRAAAGAEARQVGLQKMPTYVRYGPWQTGL